MKHWTNYWQTSGALNSFAEGSSAVGYSGDVKEFWFKLFSQLPEDSRIVDLGTGNGALALLAQLYSDKKSFDWTVVGIDAAKIDPFGIKTLNEEKQRSFKKIEFVGSTFIESMEFPDDSISAFISQFGFEYSETEKSLNKVHKSLRPKGKLCLVMHTDDSEIVIESKTGMEINETILSSALFSLARQLFTEEQEFLNNDNTSRGEWFKSEIFLTFNKGLRLIVESFLKRFNSKSEKVWVEDVVSAFADIMKKSGDYSPETAIERINNLEENLSFHNLRLKDQVKASFTKDEKELFIKNAVELNFKVDYSEDFLVEHQNAGWALVLTKN